MDCRLMLGRGLWVDGIFLPFRHSLRRIFGTKWPRFNRGGSSGVVIAGSANQQKGNAFSF